MQRIQPAWPVAMLLVLFALAGCGGGSGDVPAEPALPKVSHDWQLSAHLANGSTVDLEAPGSSTGKEVSDIISLGSLPLSPRCCVPEGFAGVTASADGKRYGAGVAAPLGDITKPTSRIGSMAYLEQIQTLRKTTDAASLDLVIGTSTMEVMDYNPHDPNSFECPEQNWHPILEWPGAEQFGCGKLIDAQLRYEILAWKEVPITDANGVVRGYGKVDLAHGTLFAHLGGYLKPLPKVGGSFLPNWDHAVGSSGDSNLKFKVYPDYYYSDCVDYDVDPSCSHAQVFLNRPTVISIPLDAVKIGEQFKVIALVTADVNNRRQLESYAAAFFRDPQGMGGVTIESEGVEVVAEPQSADVTPPPAEAVPAPVCATGSDPSAGTLALRSADLFAKEAEVNGQAFVWVTRSGGANGAVSVRLSTQDGSALAGVDYRALSTLVRFDDGEQGQRFVALPVIDNQAADGGRSLTLTLSDLRGCASLGTPARATLTILDDDTPPAPTAFNLGGAVNGLAGSGLVLREFFSGGTLAPAADGSFVFPTPILANTGYEVRVDAQPSNPAQNCVVANGAGTMGTADVSNVAVTCTTLAANGALDPTFGSGGRLTAAIGGTSSAMVLQGDGRIVALVGLKLLRFNSDGTPDTGFGSAGQASVPFNNSAFDNALGLAVQADGRIVVVGFTSIANQDDFALARFSADGTLDTTFGSGGKVNTDFAGSGDQARRVAIQGDGKIVVAGYATSGTGSAADADFAVARYNGNGTLDTSFGSGGKVRTNIAGKFDSAQGIALQPDGKVVLVGRVAVDGGSNPDFGVVRYNADGGLDAGFGSNGIVRTDFGLGSWEEANDVAVQGDGRIVVAGRVRAGAVFSFALARFNADGTPDAGFGTAGLVKTAFSSQADVAKALAIQADGRIVVVGQSASLGPNPDMAVARYLSDGSLDPAFGAAGKVSVDFFAAIDGAEGVAVQPDGRIVVGGFARNAGTTVFALARLMP